MGDELTRRGLGALLIFRQESMYYLTGYDTFGYVFFQCLVLTASGEMTLLTRAPDLRQAQFTSVIDDIRIWVDGPEASPADEVAAIVREHGLAGSSVGVEFEAYGLTAANGRRLEAAMDGTSTLVDTSDLVTKLRMVKSPAEIDYVRRAAQLCDEAWDAAVAGFRPGAFEGDILADMQSAVIRGGGDDAANEFIIGSGHGALMCRYFSGRRNIGSNDQLTLEFAGVYRHYHAAMMRTLVTGPVSARQQELWTTAQEALEECESALRPGEPISTVYETHARILDQRGMGNHRMNSCGYSLGATYAPNWMDQPMLYANNPIVAEPGMVFFLHMVIFDSDAGVAASLGRTSLIVNTGVEVLSKASTELVQSDSTA